MVLTNDGEWANRVLHPRYGVEREYAVLVDPLPTARGHGRAAGRASSWTTGRPGCWRSRLAPPPPEVTRSADERGRWLRLRVGEGRKHEVRRLFAAGGYHVERLVRTRLGLAVARRPARRGIARAAAGRGGGAGRRAAEGRGCRRAQAAQRRDRRAVRLRQEHDRARAGAAHRRQLRRHRPHVPRADARRARARRRSRRRRGARPPGARGADRGAPAAPRADRSPRDGAPRRPRRDEGGAHAARRPRRSRR